MQIGKPINIDYIANFGLKLTSSLKLLGVNIPVDLSKLFDVNFPQIINKAKNIIQVWKMRNLTLLGKVCIIKTLIASLFTYSFTYIPASIPDRYIKSLNAALYHFLWNSNWERVKRKTLIGPKMLGGIDMIDVHSFIIAQKIKWVGFLLDDAKVCKWKLVEFNYLNDLDLASLLKGNLFRNSHFIKNIPFITIKDMLVYWYNFKNIVTNVHILNQSIWYNRKLQYSRKPFYISTWKEHGISELKHLISSNTFYTYFELISKYCMPYNANDYKTYYKIIGSIPEEWNEIAQSCDDFCDFDFSAFLSFTTKNFSCKNAYRIMIGKIFVPPDMYKSFWQESFNIPCVEWNKYFTNSYLSTIETKLRSFQIKFFYKARVLNNVLYGFGLVETNLCEFCKLHIETLLHLFYNCPITSEFWSDIDQWIVFKTDNLNFNLGMKECFIGFDDISDMQFINCVLLAARFFIYRCRIQKRKPVFDVFNKFISDIRNNEKYIAMKNGKIMIHNTKWRLFI
uniref:uncharacterized protein LOC120339092 n=1 Tax=Styela clava TaxID=7725 RepID=UPI00193953CA|nr:uncharacterized protein LOC120339092 [Styela clava]